MLAALRISDVTTISDAALAKRRDHDAMQNYLHPERSGRDLNPISPADFAEDANAGLFDSQEGRVLQALIEALTEEARHELTALMWIGRGTEADFAAAVRRAASTSTEGDTRYLMGKPLYIHLPRALKKLGLAP